MPKVEMVLTDQDVENAGVIQMGTSTSSKAHAVSVALSLTRFVLDRLQHGAVLALRNPDGTLERVIMEELEKVRPDKARTSVNAP
jgi:hypothetical protein